MPPRKQKTSLPASVFHMPGAQDHPGKPDALDIPERRGATHEGVPAAAAHVLRIGPAGWSYPAWGGYVYPSRRPHGFHEAAYLSEFFDTIEINTSFYQPLKPETAKQWVDLVSGNRNFVFTAKLWQRFTHDVAFTTGGSATEDERAVRAGFDVLRAAGKLGAVLLQFPFSFHRTKETMAYLSAVLLRFRDYPLVVEVRHDTWNAPETLALLHEHGAGICNIDQPNIGRWLRPPARPPLRHLVYRRRKRSGSRALQLPLFAGRARTVDRPRSQSQRAHAAQLRHHQQPFSRQGRGQRAAAHQHPEAQESQSARAAPPALPRARRHCRRPSRRA